MKNKIFFAVFFLCSLTASPAFSAFDSANISTDKPLEISRITPKGEDVPAGRQIVIQFNRPVVPVGNMARKSEQIPVEISPPLECEWRWLNTSALSCQLSEKDALTPATRYNVTVNPGIKAEDGTTIGEPYHEEFITQRPKINYAWYHKWLAPGMPVFRVSFNQPVSKDSVERHVYLKQLVKRFPLKAEPDPEDKEKPLMVAEHQEKPSVMQRLRGWYDRFLGNKESAGDDDSKAVDGNQARRVWLVSPLEELPLDSSFDLKLEPGLVSVLGPEKGVTERTLQTFATFPEFKFLGVEGYTNKGISLMIKPGDSDDSLRFNPLDRVALVFNCPVTIEEVKEHLEFTPDLAGDRKDYDPWANSYLYSRLGGSHRDGETYTVRLPEVLKAWQEYNVKTKSLELKDEFGRKLSVPIDIIFFTDHRKPNYEIIYKTSVLEKNVDSKIPLVVTNLKEMELSYKTLQADERKDNLSRNVDIPQVEDVAYPLPLGVREMLGGKTGAVYGKISTTTPYIKKYKNEYSYFAQVTPFQVHVKIGHFNTLVWVTDLSTGKAVSGAKVSIYEDSIEQLSLPKSSQAVTDDQGVALLPGTEQLDPGLNISNWCWGDECKRLFVRVVKNGDMALLPLEGRFQVDTGRISNHTVYSTKRKKYGHIHAWGTTAQGVYRAGDTIQYKLYVRNQDNETLISPKKGKYTLKVTDPTDKTVYEVKDFELSEFGAYSGEFTVLKNGITGWYDFELSADYTNRIWYPIRVLVSDFTPSPFRVENQLNGDLFQQGDEVEISTNAKLHAGGPYADASTRITARLKCRYFSSKHRIAKDFKFDSYKHDQPSDYTVFQEMKPLDSKGKLSGKFTLPDKGIVYGRLTVESAVQDDRGKYIAASASAEYVGRDRFAGLKHTQWIYKEDEPARIKFLVVDEHGKPAKGTKIEITVERLVTKASRVKGAGNAYLTKYIDEWKAFSKATKKSGAEPGTYEFIPSDPGSYRITASIKDTNDRPHSTQLNAWVAGKGQVVWHQPDDNSLEIIPEQKEYNIGDTARYMIKNPFPGATALISIERYGVIKHWKKTLDGSTPIIEFPVKPDFLPGFYLSILVTSPRVEKPLGDGKVDLGKPAFRLGYVAVPVKDPYKEIVVKVKPEREVYKPRDTVKVQLQAKPRHRGKKEPIELAVAVLDEAVLDLLAQGRAYYDPYKGFYFLDGLDLENYSLLTRLIGRQKIEKKGANPGGGGGSEISMRSIFKFVSYWNPSIITDDQGKASIEFQVPDNLTGWRVLCMAVTPTDRMGLGDGDFKVNLPTEVRPVMPNQVTEGDSFLAGFNVMNRTDKPRKLSVVMNVSGPLDRETRSKHSEQIELAPYKKKTLWMPVKTKGAGDLLFEITARDNMDGDGLKHIMPVKKRRSLETAATYGTTTADLVTENILFPQAIHPDVGGISIVTSPSVIGNVDGAFKYMRDYPYICWEQKLSKGIMASHYLNLKSYMPEKFTWDKSDKLPEDTLDEAANFQAPNGGMVYYKPMNDYVSPYLSAYTALAFNWLRKSGYKIPELVEKRLHGYLEDLLKKKVVPDFYSPGMSSTVRAVALAALAEHGRITVKDLARYRSHVSSMSLFGKAHYLLAANKVDGAESIRKEVAEQILAHSSQTGGKFFFNEELDDGYDRILTTTLRTNAAILSAFTELGEKKEGAALVGDIPFKLVRAITQTRGNRDHWENTQENIFCMNALIDYCRIYENTPPEMTVKALVEKKLLGETQFTDLRDDAVTFQRPISETDPGRKAKVTIERKGQGRLYYAARLTFAPLEEHAQRTNSGIEIRREYSVERNNKWILLNNPMEIKRGEIVRVDIFLSLPTVRNFVVVDDPVPGGLEPVNRNLATSSAVDADKGKYIASSGSWWFQYSDWHSYNSSRWSFYHREIRHDAVRFYSDYLPAGNYHLSYTAQAIAAGEFVEMPVHAEEMYDPDVFGKGIPAMLRVSDE